MLRVRRMGGERCVATMKRGPFVHTFVAGRQGLQTSPIRDPETLRLSR